MKPDDGPTFDGLPGLLDAEDPVAWAHDNLRLRGQGDTASVFDHPHDPDVVVRVTDYPDGWFGYAMAARRLVEDDPGSAVAEAVARHAPVVHAMRSVGTDGAFYVALCERLEGVPEADRDLVEAARAILHTSFPPCLDPDDRNALAAHGRAWAEVAVSDGKVDRRRAERLLATQPGVLTLAQALPSDYTDLKDGNWLWKGGRLVLHDPVRGMRHAVVEEFHARYRHAPERVGRHVVLGDLPDGEIPEDEEALAFVEASRPTM